MVHFTTPSRKGREGNISNKNLKTHSGAAKLSIRQANLTKIYQASLLGTGICQLGMPVGPVHWHLSGDMSSPTHTAASHQYVAPPLRSYRLDRLATDCVGLE